MYTIKHPMFDGEGGAGGGSESWGSFLESKTDQPAGESVNESDDNDDQDLPDHDFDEQDEPEDDEEDSEESEEAEDSTPADEDPEIDMGDGRKAMKLSELKAGFLRQSDYTKKTQELATQRKDLETAQEGLKDVQVFKTHMDENPWLWGQINAAISEFNETGVLPIDEALQDAQYGKYINHLLSENNALKQKYDSISGEYEGVKLTNSISNLRNDLKAEYGELVTDEYMSKLQDRAKNEKLSSETLREIADGYLAKELLKTNKTSVKSASKKAEAQAVQRLAETRKTAPSAPKSTGAAPSKPVTTDNGSWGDFFKSRSS